MIAIEAIVIFLIIFIFSSLKIRNEKLSVLKYLGLIILPSILVGIAGSIISLYSYFFEVEDYKAFPSLLIIVFPSIYGLIIMSPALMFYSVYTLSLEKKFSPSKWKLFMWAGLLGGLSALPYLLVAPIEFIAVPIVTGSLAMMIVYYVSKRKKRNCLG